MRLVIVQLVIVSVVIPSLAQEENKAQELFRTFEKKLLSGSASNCGVRRFSAAFVFPDASSLPAVQRKRR
ncbi:MAG: hypothetical protein L0215_16265 [Gemmataceae bacterium]|nr:hypothetical protein [Gemmataceae bacterium]